MAVNNYCSNNSLLLDRSDDSNGKNASIHTKMRRKTQSSNVAWCGQTNDKLISVKYMKTHDHLRWFVSTSMNICICTILLQNIMRNSWMFAIRTHHHPIRHLMDQKQIANVNILTLLRIVVVVCSGAKIGFFFDYGNHFQNRWQVLKIWKFICWQIQNSIFFDL